jgi:excisionase family DNA binding protein
VPEPALEAARDQIKVAEPVYLTAMQVAELLQVDEKTVLRWSLEDASMPVLRRGRVVRFPRERLLAWLERQEPRGARRSAQDQRKPSAA